MKSIIKATALALTLAVAAGTAGVTTAEAHGHRGHGFRHHGHHHHHHFRHFHRPTYFYYSGSNCYWKWGKKYCSW